MLSVVRLVLSPLSPPSAVPSVWYALYALHRPAPQVSLHSLQSPKKVADDIAKGTQDWKGQKVTCKLTVQNRVCKVEVIPSAAALLVKALKEPSRDRKKEKNSAQLTFFSHFSWLRY